MSEQELAERFGQDIDDLLRRAEPPEREAPPDYRGALDLARTLAASERSGESQRRQATRQRLLARAAESWEREAWGRRDGVWGHPLVALPLALVTLALMCALVLPSSASWARIGQQDLVPAIETPVAAMQTAYAGLRGFSASATPSPTYAAPTPTEALPGQSPQMRLFVATGTPGP